MGPRGGWNHVSKLHLYDPLARALFIFLSLKKKRRVCSIHKMVLLNFLLAGECTHVCLEIKLIGKSKQHVLIVLGTARRPF